jgi:hypothetical protein
MIKCPFFMDIITKKEFKKALFHLFFMPKET